MVAFPLIFSWKLPRPFDGSDASTTWNLVVVLLLTLAAAATFWMAFALELRLPAADLTGAFFVRDDARFVGALAAAPPVRPPVVPAFFLAVFCFLASLLLLLLLLVVVAMLDFRCVKFTGPSSC